MRSDVLAKFTDAKRDGAGWAAKCSAHDDRRESLSIGAGDDGRTLLHCHAGCTLDAILAAASLDTRDLFPEKAPAATSTQRAIVATYPYHDEGGAHLYDVVRFAPKDFRQRRADGVWKMAGVRRILYGLRELQGQAIAYIVEGEKDADRLRAIGLPGTTSAGGAGTWRAEYTQQLNAASVEHVVVLSDNDEPGRKHAADVAVSCHTAGLQVKIVELPDLPAKGDVSDYLDAGHTKAELIALVKATPLYAPAAAPMTPVVEPADAKPIGHAPKREKPEKPKQGRGVQLEDPEPWPDPVNGAELLDAIAAMFTRYLALPAHASTALALWVLHTYAFTAWFTSPFLAITSPVKRCGKTLLLIVLGALVPRRLFASNVTPAVLFRTIEKYAPTLLIDEADTFIRDNDELRGVLNSGHTRTTAVVIRAVGEDFDPRAFSTWCAKAVALIGRLPETLADRAIEIAMRRRTAGERVARLRQDRLEGECSDLRRQAARWAVDHLPALQDADPAVPAALHDRAADCWRPLLAIADLVSGEWPARARAAAVERSGGDDAAEESASIELLRDVRTIFEGRAVDQPLPSAELTAALVAMPDRPWAEWSGGRPMTSVKLAGRLKPFGLRTRKVRDGARTVNAYLRADFLDAWGRYLPANSEQSEQPNEYRHKTQVFNSEQNAHVPSQENGNFSMFTESVPTVPSSEGENGHEGDEWEQTW